MKIQSLKDYINESSEIIRAFFAQQHFWRYFFALVIIYLIAYSALLRGDIYFLDDWLRSFNEFTWNNYSRYFATFLYNLFSAFKFLDISPLTQILAFFILALSSLIIIHSSNHKLNFFNIIAVAPLAISPFFAGIISFRFDALTISFSILFAVFPFLFSRKILTFCAISVISLVLMYATYQASSGAFLVVGLYLALRIYLSSGFKDSIKFLGAMFGAFILASLFYKFFIIVPVVVEVYVSDKMLPAEYLIPGMFRNLVVYFYNLLYFLQATPFLYFSFGLILFFIFGAISEDSKNRAKSLIASILFIVCALSLSYGAYIVLLKPLIALRSFIGFGAFVAVVSLFCVNFKARLPRILSKILVICSVYSLIVFLNAYGNAITAQEKYISFRNSILLQDLNTYIKNPQNSGIAYNGEIGYAPQAQRFLDIYGGIAKELMPNMEQGISWIVARLKLLRSPYGKIVFFADSCFHTMPFETERITLVKNAYHSIYQTRGNDEFERCYLVEYHEIKD